MANGRGLAFPQVAPPGASNTSHMSSPRPRTAAALVACTILTIALVTLPAAPAGFSQAGCDPLRPAIATHVSGAPAAASALIPCRFDTGTRAMEPSFAFTDDGRIVYQGWVLRDALPGGVPPYPVVVRSNDGVTWEDVSPLGHITTLDPVLHLDEWTGRVFSLNYVGQGSPSGSALSFSDDAGDHWITTPLGGYGFDGESIGTGPPVRSRPIGYPNLVYYCTGTTLGSSEPATTPICSKSLDGGLTFLPTGRLPFPLLGDYDLFGPWAGNPIVGPDGTLYVPKRHDAQPQIAISEDEGLTWTRVVVATNGSSSQANRATVDRDGNVYYTWTAADHLPYVAYSRDRGRTWSPPIPLAPAGMNEAAIPRVAADEPGTVAVVYLGSTNAPGAPPYYPFCNVLLSECEGGAYAGVTWNGYISQIDDLFATDPIVRTATVNDPAEPLFVGGCSAEGACMANLDFLDVHFDREGRAWGAFVDDCAIARGFTPIFTRATPRCGDGVGLGILGALFPGE